MIKKTFLPFPPLSAGPVSKATPGALLLLSDYADVALILSGAARSDDEEPGTLMGVLNGEHAMKAYKIEEEHGQRGVLLGSWTLQVDPTSAQPFRDVTSAIGHAVLSESNQGLIFLDHSGSRAYPQAFDLTGRHLQAISHFEATTFSRWRIALDDDQQERILLEHGD